MPSFNFYRCFHRFRSKRPPHGRALQELPPLGRGLDGELEKFGLTLEEPFQKEAFRLEMQSFVELYTRYTRVEEGFEAINWDNVHSPSENEVVPYEQLPQYRDATLLTKLAVLKVNGGLGASMGLTTAKCALEIKNNQTILDLTIEQMAHFNKVHQADIPLLLMTSLKTEADTRRIMRENAGHRLRIITFNQSNFPQLLKDPLLPLPMSMGELNHGWYPPGHGDLYNAIHRSGILDRLLAEGKEYLFVSNSDNLGASIDCRILQYIQDTSTDFLMEVTDRTRADVKGGTLINYQGEIRLLEAAQVPAEHLEDFESAKQFKCFNTNNLWISLRALKRKLLQGGMELDLIVDQKKSVDGRPIVELKTAAGAAIRHFKSSRGVNVPRSRFQPIKNCSDLLLIQSDIYAVQNGRLIVNEDRLFGTSPVIKLDDHFRKYADFCSRFRQIPKIIDLDHLTVSGDVYFGRDVTLRGTVIVIANEGQRIDIPDGCLLENRLITGNLTLTNL